MKTLSKQRGTFLNLKKDLIFKEYFKSKSEVLLSLLKAFIPPPVGPQIKDFQVMDSFLQASRNKKHPVLDLQVKLDTGEIINVEIQIAPERGFDKRILFYLSKIYSLNLKAGQPYSTLRTVYSLVFADFNMFPKEEGFYHSFSMRSDKAPFFSFSGDLRVVFVELRKFFKKSPDILLDIRDFWCYLLSESGCMSQKDLQVLSTKGEDMKTATSHLLKLSRSQYLRLLEEAQEKQKWILQAREDYRFDEGMEKGREEGLQEGMEKGREEGLQEGMEKGREEGMQEVALNMLKDGADIAFVAKMTKLSESEIKKLKK